MALDRCLCTLGVQGPWPYIFCVIDVRCYRSLRPAISRSCIIVVLVFMYSQSTTILHGCAFVRKLKRGVTCTMGRKEFVRYLFEVERKHLSVDGCVLQYLIDTNKAIHQTHTVISRSSQKQWLMIHTSDLMMTIRYSTHIHKSITR